MEHSFFTHRKELTELRQALKIARDVRTIVGANAHDKTCIRERREPDIEDGVVFECVERHASRLGLLLDDLASNTSRGQDVRKAHAATWAHTVCSKATVLYSKSVDDMHAALSSLIVALVADIEALEVIEGKDDSSSSYSDYSDTDTDSSDESREESGRRRREESEATQDEDEDEDEDSGEESGEEDSNTSADAKPSVDPPDRPAPPLRRAGVRIGRRK